MNKHLHLKSIALGALVGIGIAVGVAAQTQPGGDNRIGRFQIAAGGNFAYVVDSVTGQVWYNTEAGFAKPKN